MPAGELAVDGGVDLAESAVRERAAAVVGRAEGICVPGLVVGVVRGEDLEDGALSVAGDGHGGGRNVGVVLHAEPEAGGAFAAVLGDGEDDVGGAAVDALGGGVDRVAGGPRGVVSQDEKYCAIDRDLLWLRLYSFDFRV